MVVLRGNTVRGVVALLSVCLSTTARADTRRETDQVCPLDGTKFKAVLAMSGTQFGQRLDLRPVGPIASPWPVPVCPHCGFVLFKEKNEDYTGEEVQALKAVVAAASFRALPADTPSYLRLAKIFEGQKRPPIELAHAYLKASWQVETKPESNRALLAKSLEWIDKALAEPPRKDETRTTEFLRGELLRRLERFELASKQFDRLAGMKEYAEDPFPMLIARERELIRAGDASPREIREGKPR